MTACEQLAWLQRQFPRSRELAVSDELLEALEIELVQAHRFVSPGTVAVEPPEPPEVFWSHCGRVWIQRLPLMFKSSRLSLVRSV